MRIGIIGAGAIGGWLGLRLARAGHDVAVLARGATLAALRSRPLLLESDGQAYQENVRSSDDATDLGAQDMVIIAVKGPALPAVAPNVRAMIGRDTIVVPAMNGVPWWFLLDGAKGVPPMALESVDPNGAIAAAIPIENIVGCVVHASATVRGPANIVHKAGNHLVLGEPGGGNVKSDVAAQIFEQAGFDVKRSTNIRYDIWYKLWGNMTMNPISALTGATCDRILDDALVADWIVRMMGEAQAIGARIGCPITELPQDRNAVTRKLGAFKTSMLQDAEAGRPLELDQLLTAPRDIAAVFGIATPNIDALLGLTRLFIGSHGLQPASR